MSKLSIFVASAFAALTVAAAPASAVATINVVAGNCVSVTDAKGCLFTGNAAPQTAADIPLAYNAYNDVQLSAGPDIMLDYLYKSDDNGFTGTVTGTTSGTWATLDAVSYVAVKAANYFVLYKLAAPAKSGSWSTFDIPFNRNPHGLSHLTFFSAPGGTDVNEGGGDTGGGGSDVGAVPEPASWALMIAGFGMIGTAMRRRKVAAIA